MKINKNPVLTDRVFLKQESNVVALEKPNKKLRIMPPNDHPNNRHRGVETMDDFSNTRLWKTLDGITHQLGSIQDQLQDMARLQEKVNTHAETLQRFGNKLESYDERQRKIELWQAERGDRSSGEKLVQRMATRIEDIEKRADILEIKGGISKGEKDTAKEVLKWISGILGGLLIWLITQGSGGGKS